MISLLWPQGLVIRHKGAKIQLLNLPGISEGAKDGKGRDECPEHIAWSWLLWILKSLGHNVIENELEDFGTALNSQLPQHWL